MKDFVLPEAVYRQALWAVRDVGRLKEKLAAEGDGPAGPYADAAARQIKSGKAKRQADPTARAGGDRAEIALRIENIERALTCVPAEYRESVRARAFDGSDGGQIEEAVWKKWRQIFIYNVAVNLGLY